MDRMTQENSALVEQNTTASQNMAKQADHLQELLNTFKVEDSKALPEPNEIPQIKMGKTQNKIEKNKNIFPEDIKKEGGKKSMGTKSYEIQKPFE